MVHERTGVAFGLWVRTRRKHLDLTQAELGRQVGCSAAAIRKIEAEERKPSRQLAELLMIALQIPSDQREQFLNMARGIAIQELSLSPSPPNHNLPVLLTSTIDRTLDLSRVIRWLRDPAVHLVTIIGPPGIGKTRLSIHTGYSLLEDFADGVWFVDLSEVTQADLLFPYILRALPDSNLLPAADSQQLLNALRNKSLLLILDNLEQIAESAVPEIAKILQNCPRLKILATSRVPLHLYGEYLYQLPPLSIPPPEAAANPDALQNYESVQLLTARIQQHDPSFKVSAATAQAVIEICTLLDGIPLAIELAAASLRRMTIAELWNMLKRGNWIREMESDVRNIPDRQRTLENVINWSFNLLSTQQQDFFAGLGIFSGWFNEEITAALFQITPAAALQQLNALSDHSLLSRTSVQGFTAWQMLELIREFALTRLSDEQHRQLNWRKTEYFTSRLEALNSEEIPTAERLNFYNLHYSDLLSCLRWTIQEKLTEPAFRLLPFLVEYWSNRGFQYEGLLLVRELMELPDDSPAEVRIQRLNLASDLAWQQADFATSLFYAHQGLELARKHNLESFVPVQLNRLGRIYIEQEQFSEAVAVLEESYRLAHASPELLNPGSPLTQLGEVNLFENRLEESKALLLHALEHLPPSNSIFQAIALTDLAEIALQQNDFEQTRYWLKRASYPAGQHVRRMMVFLCTLAGYLTLSSQDESGLIRAASLFGALEGLRQRSGVKLIRFYQNLIQERHQALRQKLPDSLFEPAYAAGFEWNAEETLKQMTGILS